MSNFGPQSGFGGIGAAPAFVTPQPSVTPQAFGAFGTQQVPNTFPTQTQGGFSSQLQGGFGAQNHFGTQGFGVQNQFGTQVQGFSAQSQGGFGNQNQASFPAQVQPAFGSPSQGNYLNQNQAGFGGQVQGGYGGQGQGSFGGQVQGGFGGQVQGSFVGQGQASFGQGQGGFGKQSQAGYGQSASISSSPHNGSTGIFSSATTTGTGFGFKQTTMFGSSGLQMGTHQSSFASNGLVQTGALSGPTRFTPTKVTKIVIEMIWVKVLPRGKLCRCSRTKVQRVVPLCFSLSAPSKATKAMKKFAWKICWQNKQVYKEVHKEEVHFLTTHV